MRNSFFIFLASLYLCCCMTPYSMAATGNINDTEKFAWSETSGWVNFRPLHGGISVHDTHISGFAWAANSGWIKFGADSGGPYSNTSKDDWGVNRDQTGGLSGFAWSETVGWINFNPSYSQVIIDPATGIFIGFAWAANRGYIHFQNETPDYHTVTTNVDLDGDTVLLESDICVDGDDRLDGDGDGVPDFCDPCPENNPDNTDSDGDMITDCVDAFPYHTLYSSDTDNDGLPDLWEEENGLIATINDADDDSDSDGLTNIDEFNLGTFPGKIDSDGDGLSDFWEVEYGLDPLICVAYEDSEGDFDIDGVDLALFLQLFTTGSEEGDLNGDGQINSLDLSKIAATFGRENVCGDSSIPF